MADEKRSQAFAEFFITYGWALLVILVALGILVYFGLVNVEGSTCKIAPKIQCKDYQLENDKVILTIQNNMGELLLGVDVGVQGCTEMDQGNILDKDKQDIFVINGCGFKIGDRVDTLINFTYITEEGKTYTKIGKLIKTIS
ncbi:MAG: hypothetical protein V1859_07055 [archaeon]